MQRFMTLFFPFSAALAGISLLFSAAVGQAAEKVVFRYGIIRQSLAVSELTDFAQGKETSPAVDRYLARANADPAEVRRTLNKPLPVSKTTLQTLLNNPAGERMLDELGRMIQTSDDRGNREALQAALVRSAEVDNTVTILETIQNYPADEVHLDVKRMVKTYNNLDKLTRSAQEVLNQVGPIQELLKKQGIKIPGL
jgi:Alpha/beta hydrolase of unknown function (DUF1400)